MKKTPHTKTYRPELHIWQVQQALVADGNLTQRIESARHSVGWRVGLYIGGKPKDCRFREFFGTTKGEAWKLAFAWWFDSELVQQEEFSGLMERAKQYVNNIAG